MIQRIEPVDPVSGPFEPPPPLPPHHDDANGTDASADDTDAGGEATLAEDPDEGELDAAEFDVGESDAGEFDAGELDAAEFDVGESDAGEFDAGELDAGEFDAGEPDDSDPVLADVPDGESGDASVADIEPAAATGLLQSDPPTIVPIRGYYLARIHDTLRSVAAQFLNAPERWSELRSLNAAYPGIAQAGPDTLLPEGAAVALPGDPLLWGRPDPVYLWTLAETFLFTAWGREPTPEEVVPFWRGLTAGALPEGAEPPELGTELPGIAAPGMRSSVPGEPAIPPPSALEMPPVFADTAVGDAAVDLGDAAVGDAAVDLGDAAVGDAAVDLGDAAVGDAAVDLGDAAVGDAAVDLGDAAPPQAVVDHVAGEVDQQTEFIETVEGFHVEDLEVGDLEVGDLEVGDLQVEDLEADDLFVEDLEVELRVADPALAVDEAVDIVEAPVDEPLPAYVDRPSGAWAEDVAAVPAAEELVAAPVTDAPAAEELVAAPVTDAPVADEPAAVPAADAPVTEEAASAAPVEGLGPPPLFDDWAATPVPPSADPAAISAQPMGSDQLGPPPEMEAPQVPHFLPSVTGAGPMGHGTAARVSPIGRSLAGTAVGDAMMLWQLARRRRHSRRGADALGPLELSLQQTAGSESLALIDAAMRHLRAVTVGQGRPEPAVLAVRFGTYGFEVLLDRPAETPPGWRSASGGYVLELPSGTTAHDLGAVGLGPPLCPALVPVGNTFEGPLLLNLDQVGCLAVSGPGTAATSLLGAIVATLGSSPMAEELQITAVGLEAAAGLVGWERVRFARFDSPELEQMLSMASGRDGDRADIVVIGPGNDLLIQRAAQVATVPGSHLALVGATSAVGTRWPWSIHVDSTATAVVHPIAITMTAAQALSPDMLAEMSGAMHGGIDPLGQR